MKNAPGKNFLILSLKNDNTHNLLSSNSWKLRTGKTADEKKHIKHLNHARSSAREKKARPAGMSVNKSLPALAVKRANCEELRRRRFSLRLRRTLEKWKMENRLCPRDESRGDERFQRRGFGFHPAFIYKPGISSDSRNEISDSYWLAIARNSMVFSAIVNCLAWAR